LNEDEECFGAAVLCASCAATKGETPPKKRKISEKGKEIIISAGADLGFFVPQSKIFGGRGVVGAGRGLDWA
jgi:hypothetical protein